MSTSMLLVGTNI